VPIGHNRPVKRWMLALAAVVIACIPILWFHATSPLLLKDSDTEELLRVIRARQDPLSWFAGDWPLKNHFYRPVSTLSFELDNYLYRNNAAGYGLTNALLCVICVLLLFWFVRELADNYTFAAGCAVLFALWTISWVGPLPAFLFWIAWVTLAVGAWRHQKRWQAYIPAALLLFLLSDDVYGMRMLSARMIAWLPGRTASVMAVFFLAGLAAYARYERLGAKKTPPPSPGPLDPPATRNTVVATKAKAPWIWAIASIPCLILALGSYEQAVMMPAALLGVAMTLRFRGYRVRWGWQAVFWSLLVGYVVLRKAVVPSDPSHYQLQQFRNGPGVFLSIVEFLLPFLGGWNGFLGGFAAGRLILLTAAPYSFLMWIAQDVNAFIQARRDWTLCLAGYGLSFVVFLPMAWIKPFDHYYYVPMALRTILIVALLGIAGKMVVTAWSPPERQAPRRPSPAPGSLLRP